MVIVTRYALVLGVLLLLGVPGIARAGTASVGIVDVTPQGDHEPEYTAVADYRAAPGEVNDALVTAAHGVVTIHDLGALVKAGDGCRLTDEHTAACRTTQSGAPLTSATVELGDGADRLKVTSAGSFEWALYGGDGNDLIDASRAREGALSYGNRGDDTLIGSPSSDTLVGGDGADTLRGGRGDDSLFGEGYDDTLAPHHAGADLLDGGPGRDLASYTDRTVPVIADLARGLGGALGEHDRLVSIEDLEGGSARDVLRGDAGPNKLVGDGSTEGDAFDPFQSFNATKGDVLVGRAGNDVLEGSAGVDRLEGGAGDDRLYSRGGADHLTCGTGRDKALTGQGEPPARAVFVPRSCERITTPIYDLSQLRVRNGLGWTTAVQTDPVDCGEALSLTAVRAGRRRGTLLGHTRWAWPNSDPGARKKLRIRLTSAGRRAARRHQIVAVEATPYYTCFGRAYLDLNPVNHFRIRL